MKKILTGIKKAIKNIWTWIKMLMKKIWNLIKIIGKWIWIFTKKVLPGIVGITLWFLACFFIYKQAALLISDKIQAWSIVTLIFVTIFYAIQTQRLVKQEKISLEDERKKRSAEFGEKRLKEAYYPVINSLMDLNSGITKSNFSNDDLKKTSDYLGEVYTNKYYLLTRKNMSRISKFDDKIDDILEELKGEQLGNEKKSEIKKDAKKIVTLLLKEAMAIEANIEDVYKILAE